MCLCFLCIYVHLRMETECEVAVSEVRIVLWLVFHIANLWKCPGMGMAGKGYLSGEQLEVLSKQPLWLDGGGEDHPAFSCAFSPWLLCSKNQVEEDWVLWFIKVYLSVGLAPWLGSLQGQVNLCWAKVGAGVRSAGGWQRSCSLQKYFAVGLVWVQRKTSPVSGNSYCALNLSPGQLA